MVVVVLLFSTVLAGQAVADSIAFEDAPFTSTGDAVGRAGFAYLAGLRTFAAAVLWNRLDPQYHEYYSNVELKDQIQMLPTAKLVTLLDPQLPEPYYVAAWVLARRGEVDAGLELAGLGVENNPHSGLLRVNNAQILWLYGDMDKAVSEARAALGDDMVWDSPFDQHDAYVTVRVILDDQGYADEAQEVVRRIEEIDEVLGDEMPAGTHDHDGDGVPDH